MNASSESGLCALTISREATETLRPQYGHLYGFEFATPPNAEMVAWTMFEYR